ncbi:SOS response-associated peptidase [Paucidesulfovibrio longus]|uniref:SOS response-associated peptidase n=1 Tax=Paucidesulfovibrio longus TaxID=889 RepID=UPI0003B5D007|nr:SOS response-associated peptidase [Paucidesulfovibrio longus]
MCGRFGFNLTKRDIEDGFGVFVEGDGPAPDYNIAPDPTGLRPVLAVLRMGRERLLAGMAWGLVPPWSQDRRRHFVNARAETALDKPSFKHAMRHRRCLVPAGLYYEWKTEPRLVPGSLPGTAASGSGKAPAEGGTKRRPAAGAKTPWVFTLQGGAPFALAAIWEHNENAGSGLAVLTTPANALVAPVHDRMPLILPPEAYDAWLDPFAPLDEIAPLLAPFPAEKMRGWPVSRRVNNPSNHGPELMERLADETPAEREKRG